jgi:SSS family solute:Na+ symporter
LLYPLVYPFLSKLWQVGKNKGYITAADYVRDRFDSRTLALLVAITGIVATVPYIALQMYGIEVVLGQMGVPVEAALWAAFIILAAFTFVSGLRAPALIAIVKDTLIWITVIVAVIYIPIKLGGFGHIFAQVPKVQKELTSPLFSSYTSLALGSAMALFLYPHSITSTFSARSRATIERNTALLPAYTFLLGLIALFGFMAIAAGVSDSGPFAANAAFPELIDQVFPGPIAGFAYAAIAIGALVPAAVMSIAVANLFSRNVWTAYLRPNADDREQANVSKVMSTVVKLAAVLFIIVIPSTYAIEFQLAGGVWILQTFPAVFLALFIPWLNRWAVIVGWAAGISAGTWMLIQEKFATSVHILGFLPDLAAPIYIGFSAFVLNLVVCLVGTLVAKLLGEGPQPQVLSASDHLSPEEAAARS